VRRTLGALLKEIRESVGLTVQDLSTHVVLAPHFVEAVESGVMEFPELKLRDWASALRMDPHVLGGELLMARGRSLFKRAGLGEPLFQIIPLPPTTQGEVLCTAVKAATRYPSQRNL
jgi:transcriptional regulator with XRE-family HTH domain